MNSTKYAVNLQYYRLNFYSFGILYWFSQRNLSFLFAGDEQILEHLSGKVIKKDTITQWIYHTIGTAFNLTTLHVCIPNNSKVRIFKSIHMHGRDYWIYFNNIIFRVLSLVQCMLH